MGVNSSFSADAKDALARDVPEAPHCREALLASLAVYGCGTGANAFVTHRNAVARLFRSLALDERRSIVKVADARLMRAVGYRIDVPERLRAIPPKPMHRCDRVMEIRGAFLACGCVSAGRQGYHLEFVLRDRERAERLAWMLRALALPPKRMERKHRDVLYYKDFEAIVDVLTIVGAHGAVLHLSDIHALKETKNRIHRLVNTEAANLERTARGLPPPPRAERSSTWRAPTGCATSARYCGRSRRCAWPIRRRIWPSSGAAATRRSGNRRSAAGSRPSRASRHACSGAARAELPCAIENEPGSSRA